MVGEFVRREAEIAIAPLTINSQREQVLFYFSIAATQSMTQVCTSIGRKIL